MRELTVMWQLVKQRRVDALKALNVAEVPAFKRRRQRNLTQQFSAQLTAWCTHRHSQMTQNSK